MNRRRLSAHAISGLTAPSRSTRIRAPSRGAPVSRRSRFLGWVRLLAVYALVGALLALSRPAAGEVAAGALIALGGEALRTWAAGHLVKTSRLITSGPYAYVQHPLYLGRLLILTGIGVAARCPGDLNLLALGAAYAAFFFYYVPRKRRVEG